MRIVGEWCALKLKMGGQLIYLLSPQYHRSYKNQTLEALVNQKADVSRPEYEVISVWYKADRLDS